MNRLIQEVESKGINPFQFLQFFLNLNKNDRTSYWVGHSYLKELDTIFLRKKMIEKIEAKLTESSKKLKPDNLAVTEEADVDEAIPFNFEKNKKYKHIKIQ